MFKAPVEMTEKIESLKTSLEAQKTNYKDLELKFSQYKWETEQKASLASRESAIKVEETKNEIRKEMQKALIESDLKRVEAIAKLETYEKLDTKTEREAIRQMLDKAIAGLSARPIVSK